MVSGYGTLVCLGAGTATYFLADNSYKQYQDATNVKDMQDSKDAVNTYDDYTMYAAVGAGTMFAWYLLERTIIKSQRKVNAVKMSFVSPDLKHKGLYLSAKW